MEEISLEERVEALSQYMDEAQKRILVLEIQVKTIYELIFDVMKEVGKLKEQELK